MDSPLGVLPEGATQRGYPSGGHLMGWSEGVTMRGSPCWGHIYGVPWGGTREFESGGNPEGSPNCVPLRGSNWGGTLEEVTLKWSLWWFRPDGVSEGALRSSPRGGSLRSCNKGLLYESPLRSTWGGPPKGVHLIWTLWAVPPLDVQLRYSQWRRLLEGYLLSDISLGDPPENLHLTGSN
jgi:hypothetical protein